MNPHIGAAMWVVAMMIGFVIWWPIGAMILASITITAISQQLTGYQVPEYEPLPPLHFDEQGKRVEVSSNYIPPTRQIAGPPPNPRKR